jgi:hypothetical protein
MGGFYAQLYASQFRATEGAPVEEPDERNLAEIR